MRLDERIIQWEARFSRMSDTIDPNTRTLGLIASVDNNYGQTVPGQRPPLVKGMFVEVELRARPIDNVIVVPRFVIVGNRVFVADADNRLMTRDVKVGLQQGELAVITEGLNAGDRVIVSDIAPAIDGMLLKIVEDTELTARLISEASGGGRWPGTVCP